MNKLLILLLYVFLANNLFAQTSHTHGAAKLNIIYDEGQLHIELETPAANVLGFEDAPLSKDEKAQYSKVMGILSAKDRLFTITPKCKLIKNDIDSPFSVRDKTDHIREDQHVAYSTNEHTHEQHKEHDEHDNNQFHTDFILHYAWQCEKLNAVNIKLHIFDLFSEFEKIEAQWIAFNKQRSVLLNKNNTVLEMAP